jgi:uncharacterized protein YktB (UPF0637 family)
LSFKEVADLTDYPTHSLAVMLRYPYTFISMSKQPQTSLKKKKGHFGKGLIAGAIFGIAAGIFMSSREGKQMAKNLESQAKMIERKLRGEFKKKSDLTKNAYEEAIDSVLAYYIKSKKIAKTELPALKRYLEDKWELVKDEMGDVRKEQVQKTTKKSAPRKR